MKAETDADKKAMYDRMTKKVNTALTEFEAVLDNHKGQDEVERARQVIIN